ncbi:MAG: response regulator [Pseudomonadota bacterium]|nr:response regulator [Pseudomonadota bacterium]
MTRQKLLLVDDTKTNIDILINLLKEHYDLVPALSGQKALSILEKVEVDLILLDIMMPEMDGYEVCEAIKSNDKTKALPVIFVTAKNDAESIAKAKEVGGIDVILKPFEAQQLLNSLQTHLIN